VRWLVGWLDGWMAGWLFAWLVGWCGMFGWLVAGLDGWLVLAARAALHNEQPGGWVCVGLCCVG
jgi:hypothetical protein